MEPATELQAQLFVDTARDVTGAGSRLIKEGPGTAKNVINLITQTAKNALEKHRGLAIAGGVIGIVISALLIIRLGVALFYRGAGNLKKWVKTNADILKANLKIQNDNETAVAKQKKMLENLENVADTIDYSILKTERESSVDVTKSNRENYSPADFKNINGADFEF